MTRVGRKDRDYDLSLPVPLPSWPKTCGQPSSNPSSQSNENGSRHSFHRGGSPNKSRAPLLSDIGSASGSISRTSQQIVQDQPVKTLGNKSGQIL